MGGMHNDARELGTIQSLGRRYDARKKKYTHSFVPFLWAIVAEETAAVYDFILKKLDELVNALSDSDNALEDVINLCVHDAHQGAISACEENLPGVRNGTTYSIWKFHDETVAIKPNLHFFAISARCFYHFSKNLRDNKKRLGAAFELIVERCIFPLHISTNDDLYHLLADALVDEARTGSTDAGKYLEATLNTDRYGYPNIAITAEGLRWNQVVNNIVEAVYSIMSKALHGESFDVGMFVREAILERFIEQPAGVAVGAPCGDSVSNGENKFGSPVQQNPLGGDSYDVNDTIIVSDMDRPEGGQVGDTPSCIACLACLAEA
ncbi:hypothetical protein FOZ62_025953 [Perkinsus olseni]|uniref:Uncharacterized protein n=1 Tax=Perkinsus olseni TaxID=32597 RepID=A0A7J6RMP0_PEROL|nr:hypothetical protein FOZ62_025953 [Perkinsus olseni]